MTFALGDHFPGFAHVMFPSHCDHFQDRSSLPVCSAEVTHTHAHTPLTCTPDRDSCSSVTSSASSCMLSRSFVIGSFCPRTNKQTTCTLGVRVSLCVRVLCKPTWPIQGGATAADGDSMFHIKRVLRLLVSSVHK